MYPLFFFADVEEEEGEGQTAEVNNNAVVIEFPDTPEPSPTSTSFDLSKSIQTKRLPSSITTQGLEHSVEDLRLQVFELQGRMAYFEGLMESIRRGPTHHPVLNNTDEFHDTTFTRLSIAGVGHGESYNQIDGPSTSLSVDTRRALCEDFRRISSGSHARASVCCSVDTPTSSPVFYVDEDRNPFYDEDDQADDDLLAVLTHTAPARTNDNTVARRAIPTRVDSRGSLTPSTRSPYLSPRHHPQRLSPHQTLQHSSAIARIGSPSVTDDHLTIPKAYRINSPRTPPVSPAKQAQIRSSSPVIPPCLGPINPVAPGEKIYVGDGTYTFLCHGLIGAGSFASAFSATVVRVEGRNKAVLGIYDLGDRVAIRVYSVPTLEADERYAQNLDMEFRMFNLMRPRRKRAEPRFLMRTKHWWWDGGKKVFLVSVRPY